MIVAKLCGGLGNQLFQFALGRKLSLLNKSELLLDIKYYENQNLRNFELDYFELDYKIASTEDINRAKNEDTKINLLKRKFRTLVSPYYKRAIVEEVEKFKYDKNIYKINLPAYIDGYWQAYKYF